MGLINTLQGIGDAIREKAGTNEPIPLKNMAEIILNLSGGANCKSAVYNEDDTITLIDNNDKEHIIKCMYGDNVLESVTYDGEIIELVYDEGALIKVADTQIDVSKAPVTSDNNTCQLIADSSVISVILPVTVPSILTEIKNNNIKTDSSVSLEE